MAVITRIERTTAVTDAIAMPVTITMIDAIVAVAMKTGAERLKIVTTGILLKITIHHLPDVTCRLRQQVIQATAVW